MLAISKLVAHVWYPILSVTAHTCICKFYGR